MTALVEPEWALVSLMFVDIRGFTAFAHRVTAVEACARLNDFYGAVIPVLARHGGHANQLLGDGVLGVFGTPTACPDHADRALAAGCEILDAIEARLGEQCRIGIGINSGLVLAGTLGAGELVRFSVVGDPVNVASRVQGATGELGERLLLTEATRRLLEHPPTDMRACGTVRLKGKPEPVEVHAPTSRNADRTPTA